jgi:predicted unusual protein kinase regulating ubiquinone biosynthesis (AarF/ABC1/UbiB family)
MDRVDGVKATEIGGLRRTEQRFGRLAAVLTRAYLDQVFVHGEIHADPHPGNVLVTGDGRLGLLDLGMIAHVPPRQRERLLKLLFAAVDGRGEEVAHECIAIGTRLEGFDEEAYFREVGQLVSRYASRRGGAGISEGRLVLDLTVLGSTCRLRTPPELSLLGKTLLNLESVSAALDPDLDTKAIVEDHLEHVLRERARKSFSPARLASEAIELQALVREAPRKLADVLSHLAENRMQVKVVGLDESHLMESIQKVANRVAAGLIVAALIVGSALLLQVPTQSTLFGYPTLAIVMFLAAAALGLGIVVSVLLSDRPRTRRETPGMR